jgi:membrane protein DedA with SNARE-associated domain
MTPALLTALILQYRYIFLVPAALAWGLLVCMLVGVAVRLGTLELVPAYAAVMLGELIGDVFWYWAGWRWGERFANRFGKYVGIDRLHIELAERLFRKYDQLILLASKLTTGFGFAIPILFTAGMTHMSFFRYMRANFIGQFFWSGGLIAIGYFFGDLYLRVNNVFEKATVVSLAVILILLFIGFARYMRRRMMARN